MIVNKKIILKKTLLDIPIILFLLSQIISSIFSIDKSVSIFGYYGRFNGGLISIISYIILFYGFISNEINYQSVLKTSLISSLVVIIWGLPGKFGHDLSCPVFSTILLFFSGNYSDNRFVNIWKNGFNNSCWSTETNVFDPASRMFSTLGQPNWLGAFLAINFFIGLYFLLKNKNNTKYLVLNTIYLLLNFIVIVFTRSRSALASVIVSLLIFPILYFLKPIIQTVKKYWLYFLSGFLILGILSLFIFISTTKKSNSSVTDSLDIRKIVWQGAISLGLKYPFFGTGVETFAYSYFFVRPVSHNLTSEWDYLYNKAHNEYLNYLATTGFIGLLTYLGFIGTFIILIIRKIKDQKHPPHLHFDFLTLSLFCGWLTILMTNFFGFSTTTINIYFYLIPAILIMATMISPSVDGQSSGSLQWLQKFQIFIILSFTVYLLFSISVYFLADISYAQGIAYLKPSVADYQKAAYYLDRAIKLHDDSVYEDKFSYSLAYISVLAAQEKNTELANQYLELSNYFNQKSLKSSPENVLYWKTRAKNQYLYYMITLNKDNLIEGISSLEKARFFSPTDPKIPYSLVVFYSMLGDLEKNPQVKKTIINKMFSELDKMLKLKPDFQDGITLKKEILKKYQ